MFLKYFDLIAKERDLFKQEYIGKVLDNEDPDKKGRIKVSIPNLFEGEAENLPWVYACNSGGSDFISLNIPEVDSFVIVCFPHNDIYFPIYKGSVLNEIDSDLEEDYPMSYGMVDSIGNKFLVNKTSGEIKIIHKEGTEITIEGNGAVSVTTSSDITLEGDNVNIESSGEATFEGIGGTNLGVGSSSTVVLGMTVALGMEGGLPVAVVGSQCIGVGNMGAPVISNIVDGSSIVTAPK